ncbi:MAG: cation:proton antiporter [Patescibacteria group bacterium]|nr:cation:proton antiporter [Patescibacteria group bacterium]
MTVGIFELAIVILIAAALGVAAKLLRQPIILAYLGAGLLIGALGFTRLLGEETFHIFSNLGVMFLLFLVGMQLNYASLRLVGKASVLVGLGQIVFTSLIGYGIAIALGFIPLHAVYIAVALTLSSTIIIVKLLSDKKDLNSLYGKISVGFLLVQDFVAILFLIFLAGLEVKGGISPLLNTSLTIVKGIALFAIMFWLGHKILPKIFDQLARSEELLFLISLAWLFMVAAVVSKLGFSVEIAGFLAGLALANSSERFQISSRVSSLRDFFILIFFVILGSSVSVSVMSGLILPVIIFSLFVLIGNPLIVLIIMGIMGYRKRTSFFAGVTVAQISEFSLILAAMGLKVGHLNELIVALISAVGIITIGLSTYLIVYADKIYKKISPLLFVFEKKNVSEVDIPADGFQKSIVLIGCHRTGESIAASLPKEDVLIVDFDPDVLVRMKKRGYATLYGDARDREIFEVSGMVVARLVISTSPDLEDNLTLLEELKIISPRPKVVVRAETEEEAKILYEAGADYVLLPHFTSGQYFGKTIAVDPQMGILDELKNHDLELLGKEK